MLDQASATTAACQPTDRRDRVVTGRLADDFLRIRASDDQVLPDSRSQQATPNPAYRLAAGFVPAKTVGRLSVTVTQANLTKNYGLMKMDPYCRIRIGNTVFETPTDANGGKSPVWNRTIYCYLPSGVDSIYLEIFDERSFTNDERVAWAHVRIPEAVFKGDTIDEWYSLSGNQGDGKEGMINLVMTLHNIDYVPMAAPGVTFLPTGQPLAQPVMLVPVGDVPYNACANQPTVVPCTAEDLKELKEMFPNIEDDVIRSIFEEKRGNKEAIVNDLLALSS